MGFKHSKPLPGTELEQRGPRSRHFPLLLPESMPGGSKGKGSDFGAAEFCFKEKSSSLNQGCFKLILKPKA